MAQKHTGETIVEVLVAFTILAIVLTSVLLLFEQTLNLQVSVRNRVTGLYLAQEGLEGVRQIRDSNWIEFSGDRRAKWLNSMDGGDRFYELTYDLDAGKYVIGASSVQHELNFSIADFQTNTTRYAPYQIHESTAADEGLFTLDDQDRGGSDNTPTQFYRQIGIEVLNPYDPLVDDATLASLPAFCDGDDPTCNGAQIRVTSSVGWLEGSTMNHLVLQTYLFDYLGRHEY